MWRHEDYDIVHFILAGLYIVLGILCLSIYFKRPKQNTSTIQKIFYPSLLCAVTVRAFFMAMQPIVREGLLPSFPNQVNVILNIAPSFVLFSAYLIVLFIWVEMYLIASGGSTIIHKLPYIFYVLSFFMYSAVIALFIADFVLYPPQFNAISSYSNPIEKAIGIYDGCCFILTSLAFLFFGFSIIFKFRSQQKNFTEERRMIILKRVSALTALIVVCFAARACITIFAAVKMNLISGTWWWFDGAYYCGLEIVPISIMLYLLKMGHSNNSNGHHHHPINTMVNSYNHSRRSNGNEYSPLLYANNA
ncbi:hypothetical protein DFA_01759 [Cavenderia fasciculata]|uniref:THH1/TOM1/TOM3 domain-containing protein n=1 Tax=Cavenderia fasciculata TaxID=261658 RepID=F4PUK9_CACFS|nr:uncharacterized protein DFA_01759 [Cavenderia fasciculata]EGG21873.1 hypothetical protein DFA_01759 [Cavenderia fasciculata]|eukprot:XP_004359724.1 hypothetical protein DFA_01759 [Cavenderia fasciculata]